MKLRQDQTLIAKTMDTTDVYNYLKRLARKTYNTNIDCLAEAMISTYGDDYDIHVSDLKTLCVATGYMTAMDFREMECHVTTSLKQLRERVIF